MLYELPCPFCRQAVSADSDFARRRVRCPHCRGEFELQSTPSTEHAAEPLASPPSAPTMIASIPVGSQTVDTPPPIPRVEPFSFWCARCESVLEAHSGQCGLPGKCPSCATEFLIPEFDTQTKIVGKPRDIAGRPENPTPVHAYAAAGGQAPEIVGTDSDDQAIRCPRCHHLSPIDSDRCRDCGLAFTLEGVNYAAVPNRRNGYAVASLIMALLGVPCSVLVVPQVLAVFFGGVAMFQVRRDPLSRGQGLAVLGIALGVLSLTLTATALIMKR